MSCYTKAEGKSWSLMYMAWSSIATHDWSDGSTAVLRGLSRKIKCRVHLCPAARKRQDHVRCRLRLPPGVHNWAPLLAHHLALTGACQLRRRFAASPRVSGLLCSLVPQGRCMQPD